MRTLTPSEVENEVKDISTKPWPLFDMLFMKNLYNTNPPHIGVLLRKNDVIEPRVKVLDNGAEGEFIPYESIKALVEAGWVVD